eukprot:3068071-Rhodomonas_salina.1
MAGEHCASGGCAQLRGKLTTLLGAILAVPGGDSRLATSATATELDVLADVDSMAEVVHLLCVVFEMCFRLWDYKREIGESTEGEDFFFKDLARHPTFAAAERERTRRTQIPIRDGVAIARAWAESPVGAG